MYSIERDLIWDPFGGIETTSIAAIMSSYSSITIDVDSTFIDYSIKRIKKLDVKDINLYIQKRI